MRASLSADNAIAPPEVKRFVFLLKLVYELTKMRYKVLTHKRTIMSSQEFRAAVAKAKPPGVSEKSLGYAIAFFEECGRTARREVRECVQLADRFEKATVSDRTDGTKHFFPLTPGVEVMSEQLTAAITPKVAQVRQQLFGSAHAPFAAYEQAVEWLERTAEEARGSVSGHEQKLRQDIQAKAGEWHRLTGGSVNFQRRILSYAKPGDSWMHACSVHAGSPLERLATVLEQIEQATGFSQCSVLAFILADIKPLLSPLYLSFTMSSDAELQLFHMHATLTVSTPDVTLVELKTILRTIRQRWAPTPGKTYHTQDAELLALVQHCGGVPQTGKAMFWEQVRQRWNKTRPVMQHHKTWRSTRMRYSRLQQKLPNARPRDSLCNRCK
jgi:hypothetical protein